MISHHNNLSERLGYLKAHGTEENDTNANTCKILFVIARKVSLGFVILWRFRLFIVQPPLLENHITSYYVERFYDVRI